MSKAFTTYTLLKGKEPQLRRMVCEIRFDDGHLYLDNCGHLLSKLVKSAPEWVLTPDPAPSGTTAYHLSDGCRLSLSMHAASMDLDRGPTDLIDDSEVVRYIEQTDRVLGLVADEFEVTEYTRLGFREWYEFPCDSKEDAENWIRELKVVELSPQVLNSFQGVPEAMGLALVLQGQDCHYRIGLNGVERSAQVPIGDTNINIQTSKASKRTRTALLQALKEQRQRQRSAGFAVVLDIDAYLEQPTEPDVGSFLRDRTKTNLQMFRNAVSPEPAKKGT